MIIVSEQKDGISAVLRMVHDSIGKGKIQIERERIIKEYGEYDKIKQVEDAMRLYYEWGNIDIIKT